MTSAIPAWKAELQRRKKEKSLNKDLNKDKKKWVDDFNEPVNVIIVSATNRDPDGDFDEQDPFSRQRQGDDKANNGSSRGVSEEHVSSVKNNPFLKFDQLMTSRSPGSPTRPAFLRRRSSGSISSLQQEEQPETKKLDYKSRSKSVDNLSFRLLQERNRDQAEQDTGRVHGKGLIASLRERFGKPASADEFLAVVRKPRSVSQSSTSSSAGTDTLERRDRDHAQASITNISSSVKVSEKETHKKSERAKDQPRSISNGPSSKDTSGTSSLSIQSLSKTDDQRESSGPHADRSSSPMRDMAETSDQVTRLDDLPAKPSTKAPDLSASALISLNRGSSNVALKGPSSVVDVEQSTGEDGMTSGNDRELKDETDSIGKLPPLATVGHGVKVEQRAGMKDVEQIEPESIREGALGNNGNEKLRGDASSDDLRNREPTGEVESYVTLTSNRKLVPSDEESDENNRTDLQKLESQGAIRTPPKSEIPVKPPRTDIGNQVIQTTVSSGKKVDEAKTDSAGTSSPHRKVFRLATAPSAARQSDISSSNSSPKPADTSGNEEESQGAPFAVKLRKVEKPPSAGIRVVRSSKGGAPNKKAPPKRDVKAVLREQVNGEVIPVTNIDDVELEEDSKEPAPVVEVPKVDFEVIGYNTKTSRTSLANGKNRRNKDQIQLRFDDQNIQTHEYQSEESALKDYIAVHGYEPEEDFNTATGNGDDDDDDNEDETDAGGPEAKKQAMNNNTSLFAQGLQNITKSNNVDLSSFLGRGPHKKEAPVARPFSHHSPPPQRKPEPEVVATPLDDGDGFSMGSSAALLF